jgi:hypothetical protein
MARTQVRTSELENGGVTRDDLNSADTGKAVVKKLVQGTGISLSSSGADAGTGDVTVNATLTPSSTDTFTNKRVNPRVSTTASSSTPTPNADTDDFFTVTALAANATFGAPTGTPVNGQRLLIRILDNGTARTLAFNAAYRFSSDLAAPTTTILSKTLYLGFFYNSAASKWDCAAILNGFA